MISETDNISCDKHKNSGSTKKHSNSLDTKGRLTKIREVTRILRYLSDDLARLFPNEKMPSSWMVKCLVTSSFKSNNVNADWEDTVIGALRQIMLLSSEPINAYSLEELTTTPDAHFEKINGNKSSYIFYDQEPNIPLFPNAENFTMKHANRFAYLAIRYLTLHSNYREH